MCPRDRENLLYKGPEEEFTFSLRDNTQSLFFRCWHARSSFRKGGTTEARRKMNAIAERGMDEWPTTKTLILHWPTNVRFDIVRETKFRIVALLLKKKTKT